MRPPKADFYFVLGLSTVLIALSFSMVYATNPGGIWLSGWYSLILLAYGAWRPSSKKNKHLLPDFTPTAVAVSAATGASAEAGHAAANQTLHTQNETGSVVPPYETCCYGLVSPPPTPRFFAAAWVGALVVIGSIARLSMLVAWGQTDTPEIAVWMGALVQVFNTWRRAHKDIKKPKDSATGVLDIDAVAGAAAAAQEEEEEYDV